MLWKILKESTNRFLCFALAFKSSMAASVICLQNYVADLLAFAFLDKSDLLPVLCNVWLLVQVPKLI